MSKPIELIWLMKIWSKNVFRKKDFFGQRILDTNFFFEKDFGQKNVSKKIFAMSWHDLA